MILLVTNEEDLTTDFIVLELKRRGREFLRLNTEKLPTFEVSFRPEDGVDAWSLSIGDVELDFQKVTAAFYRRPGVPEVAGGALDHGVAKYAQAEWASVLALAINSIRNDRWLNSPSSIQLAEDKPKQLALAHVCGFRVPETVVTNCPTSVREFAESASVVVKPVRQALVQKDGAERVIFTRKLVAGELCDAASIKAVPFIAQHEVPKKYDIRVTVVGDRIFAAEIHSQLYESTQVDWRCDAGSELPHVQHMLPEDIQGLCIELTKKFGLRFSAIDLILDNRGSYWFLEINPNGQWAWIENRTGLPIASAIVDELEAIAA